MAQPITQGEPLKILLVEDNPSHAEMVMRSFQTHRIANEIDHVHDGEQALDYLHHRNDYSDSNRFSQPDLVLLDLRLPKIDGLEVLDNIKSTERLLTIPVVILTTSTTEIDRARAYKHHANSYLVKPIDFNSFTNMMNDLGYYWLVWNHLPFDDK
ncbi:MAG: response regulator [Pseudomonadales bacterium]|nr:response regulator [Pseudomonadales bacterium]